MKIKAKVVLVVLDGIGYNPDPKDESNAWRKAKAPFLDYLLENFPNGRLRTSGEDVGLPPGVMGNSEIGHLNLGAGRIVYTDLTLISKALESEEIEKNPVFSKMIKYLKGNPSSRAHLLWLLSDGGVHSHIEHLKGIIRYFRKHIENPIFIHAFLDGRDTSPTSGVKYIQEILSFLSSFPQVFLSSIIGRYYAMDRDKRWDRVKKAYDLLTLGKGERALDPIKKVEEFYQKGITDEFMEPIFLQEKGVVKEKDLVLFGNFRADRARELTRAFIEEGFSEFSREISPKVYFISMTQYHKDFSIDILFPPLKMEHILGEVISSCSLKQFRIAETEKYAHVTFFFNGGRETPYEGEERVLIPSPKVATYDLKPEMSAYEVTMRLIEEIRKEEYSFILVNYANGDMVGHTGSLEAAIKAVEAVDICLRKVITNAMDRGYVVFVTADHGNCEKMLSDDNTPFTQHTTFPVPFIWVEEKVQGKPFTLPEGRLADVAPTVLFRMGIPIPRGENGMTGEVLIPKDI